MKNKGFTMVELLVAMAIMGLLIIMAFPTIRAIQSNNTSTKYKEYGKSVISATKLYTDSYEEDLFDLNDTNNMTSIDLNDLVKKDLLKDISLSDSTCLNGSSVNIIKYKDDYTYCLNLICSTGGKEVYKEQNKEGKCKDLIIHKVKYSATGQTGRTVSVVQGNNHTVLTPGAAHISIPNGYKFVKWNSSIGKKKAGEVIAVNSDIEFTPELESFKYKIRYRTGLNPPVVTGEQPCTVGESCKLQANSYHIDYHTFDGYKYNGKDYKAGAEMKNEVTITKDNQIVDVTAKFRENRITVNYYSNGGELQPNPSQSCPVQAECKPADHCGKGTDECREKKGLVKVIEKPLSDEGYSSHGKGMPNYDTTTGASLYMTKSGCTGTNFWHIGSPTSNNKINENHTYTATKSTFDKMIDFAKDSRVGKGEELKKGDISVNVYAGWDCTKTITVTFNCNGGTGGGTQKFTTGVSGNKFNKSCTLANNTQDGWKINRNATKRDYSTNSGVADSWIEAHAPSITLYAHWKKTTYTLKFDKNGGTGTCNDITRNPNAQWGSLCTPTRTGYTFGGWYEGNTKYTSTTKATKNVTVKAKWTINKYTVKLKAGSGINSIKINGVTKTSGTYDYGTKLTLTTTSPDYYQFNKWSDGNTNKSRNITVTNNINLTATGRKNKFVIYYNLNGGKLKPGPVQKCPKEAGCKKNECIWYNNGTSSHKRCTGNSTGTVSHSGGDTYDGDNNWSNEGVRNYAKKYNSTLYAKRDGYKAKGTWKCGSNTFSEGKKFSTPLKLVEACGNSYKNAFKKGDIEITIYAQWEKK